MDNYGLIGKNINYSFSKNYFTKKFAAENISAVYKNFDINTITQFPEVIAQEGNQLKGLNVTIPYKEAIIPYLDTVDDEAEKIGAVNTISLKNNQLTGHNTDYYGFMKSLFPLLEKHHTNALILGTGGASKAVMYALDSLGIAYKTVSREAEKGDFTYIQLSEKLISTHQLIINCTPLGTFPEIEKTPDIPYTHLTSKHLLFDLVYNPPLTTFLANGKAKNCKLCNGQKMLEYQAEQAWSIWNTP